VEEVRVGEWTVVHLTTSYGCELIALAKGRLNVMSVAASAPSAVR
jgi:hypothetical protein